MLKQRPWTPAEDRLLRDEYGITPLADLARAMGRSVSAVKQRANKGLGLTIRAFWTPEEDTALRRIYPDMTAEECARWIGRSVSAIHARANLLGLKKSREWIAEQSRIRMADPNHPGRKTQFRAGHTTWNTGMKGLKTGGDAGWFKPGQKPHNAHPIGSHRRSKEGYLQRKMTETGYPPRDWVPVHHLVWRMHGRSIPPSHALCFIDGDKDNLDINNLELIHRRELMARNTRHRLPEELNQVISLKAALTRRINNLEGSNQP